MNEEIKVLMEHQILLFEATLYLLAKNTAKQDAVTYEEAFAELGTHLKDFLKHKEKELPDEAPLKKRFQNILERLTD